MTLARPRLALVALLAAGAVAVAIVGLASGGEDATADSGPLSWAQKPIAFTHPTLPTDHIVAGTLRNDGLERLRIVAMRDIRVRAADGTALETTVVFSKTFGHGLFDPTRVPEARLPERELMRIGDVGLLEPGKELPVTIAWRERPGGPHGARVAYPGGSLEIPPER